MNLHLAVNAALPVESLKEAASVDQRDQELRRERGLVVNDVKMRKQGKRGDSQTTAQVDGDQTALWAVLERLGDERRLAEGGRHL